MFVFPFADLQRLVRCPIHDERQFAEPTRQDWATLCNVSYSIMKRWMKDGLTVDEADRVACDVAGMHPSLIWPEWYAVTAALAAPPPRKPRKSKRVPLTKEQHMANRRRKMRHAAELRKKVTVASG